VRFGVIDCATTNGIPIRDGVPTPVRASAAARQRIWAFHPRLEVMEDRTLLATLVFGDGALGSTVSAQTQRQTEVLDGLDGVGQTTKENKLDYGSFYSYDILSVNRPEDQASINLGVTARGGFSFKSLQTVSQSAHLTSGGAPGSVTVQIAAGPDEAIGDAVTVNLGFSFKVTGYGAINAETEAKYGAGYVYKGAATKLASADAFLGRGYADNQSGSFDAKIGDTFTLYLDDVVAARSTPDYHFGQVGYWTDLALNLSVVKKPPDIAMEDLKFNGSDSSFLFDYEEIDGADPFDVGLYYSPTPVYNPATAVPVINPDTGQPATETVSPEGATLKSATFTFSRPPDNPSHYACFIAVANYDNKVTEINKANDAASMEIPDIAVKDFKWHPDVAQRWSDYPTNAGGIQFDYTIDGSALPKAAPIVLSWAKGSNWDNKVGTPITTRKDGSPLETETAPGSYHVEISASSLGMPEAGATDLLIFIDPPDTLHPQGSVPDRNRDNNKVVLDASAESILRGSVHYEVSGAKIWARFMPAEGNGPPAPEEPGQGALTIDQAKGLLGVSSFNWIQTVTLPDSWSAYSIDLPESDDPGKLGYTIKSKDGSSYAAATDSVKNLADPTKVFPSQQLSSISIPDPLVQSPGAYDTSKTISFMVVFNVDGRFSVIALPSAAPLGPIFVPPDSLEYYYNLGAEADANTDKYQFSFYDKPTLGKVFGPNLGLVHFTTKLAGVKPDNSPVTWDGIGTNFKWNSDAVSADVVDFLKADNPAVVPPAISGGVKDVTFDLPPQTKTSSDIFQAVRNFRVDSPHGGYAEAVAAGDFNGDGHQDILMSFINAGNGLYVLPGRGDGTFGEPIASAPNESFTTIAVADFNGDGKLDVAAAVQGADFVSVFMGKGDGTFGSETDVPAGQSIYSIVAADFNGDGKPDLAVANAQSKGVTVLLNAGNGTFRPAVSYPTVGTFPAAIVAADFNGDGKPDLAVLNWGYGGMIDVFLNKGDGTFNPDRPFASLSGGVYHLAAGDVDGDGKIDLVISDNDSGKGVHVMYGQGDGTFQAPVMLAAVTGVQQIYVGDLNGDGKADIAARGSYTVTVLLSNGRGQAPTRSDMIVGHNPEVRAIPAFVAADFNGDKHPDLATSGGDTRTASVLLNRGDGTFPSADIEPLALGGDFQASGLATQGDFNGDGRMDIALASYSGYQSRIDVLLTQPDGGHTIASTLLPGTLSVTMFTTGNFDGDGKLDLLVYSSGSGRMAILSGNGDGTFTIHPIPITARPFRAIVAGDFNGDGLDDIAAIEVILIDTPFGKQAVGNQLDIFINQGDGVFGEPLAISGDGSDLTSLAVADFNGDGKQDITMVSLNMFGGDPPGTKWVLLGNGDGTFREPEHYPGQASAVSVADFNGDGKPDLLVFESNIDSFGILLNQGGGTFAAEIVTHPGAQIGFIRSGDFNQDGHLDVIASTLYGDALLLGKGDGTFGDAVYYATGPARAGLAIDFNGDGKLDFVVPRDKSFTTTGPVLTILENKFAPPPVTLMLAPIAGRAVAEGTTVSLTASATDSEPSHRLTYSLDPGAPDGATIDPKTGAFSFAAASGPAAHAITVRVTDADVPAVSTTQTFLISVSDVAPSVSAGGDASALAGVLFTRDGSFTDPGAETWFASVDYGDGAGTQPVELNPDKTFHLQHVYATAGTYPVTVVVSDNGGQSGTSHFSLSVSAPQPSAVQVTAAPAVVDEANGKAVFTITRTGDTRGTAVVQYATADGTALAGQEYLATSGSLAFGPGESSRSITVEVLHDAIVEGPSTFQVQLLGATSAALGTAKSATVTILDSTAPGQLAFAASALTVRAGSGQATITVARSGGTDGDVTVHYQTTDGTARAGVDYTAASGTLTFAWGESSQQIVIPLVGAVAQADKAFTLTLSDPGGGTALGAIRQATVTITSGVRSHGVLSFDRSSYPVGKNGQAALTITRSGGAAGIVSVEVVTIASDAARGVDTIPAARRLTFAPGETSKTVIANLARDRLLGANLKLRVELREPSGGATLGGVTSAPLIVQNVQPAPLVTMTGVRLKTNKDQQVTAVIISLSGPVNSSRAGLVAIYALTTAGKKGSFDAKDAKTLKIKSAVYNAASNTVTLNATKPFTLDKPVQLRISGVGPLVLTDALGRAIDGDRDGKPGGNATALLLKGGRVKLSAPRG
jgi:hypothetical protein